LEISISAYLCQWDNPQILCPVAKIGDINAVDRDEINGLADIYKLILKYLQDKDDKKPLSLAIFGPPGTGKSSTVKKILKAARSATAKAEGGEALGCNLSQLTDPKNLTAAFHQAQDRALAEEVPLVFFDEFDTSLPEQPYGWLKYFLAPMEDGTFKPAEANESYRVGKAIFAFAGGTAETFEKFQEYVGENKEVKGPDFISRLISEGF
jgi:DNA polymerase III delta prime subunit